MCKREKHTQRTKHNKTHSANKRSERERERSKCRSDLRTKRRSVNQTSISERPKCRSTTAKQTPIQTQHRNEANADPPLRSKRQFGPTPVTPSSPHHRSGEFFFHLWPIRPLIHTSSPPMHCQQTPTPIHMHIGSDVHYIYIYIYDIFIYIIIYFFYLIFLIIHFLFKLCIIHGCLRGSMFLPCFWVEFG